MNEWIVKKLLSLLDLSVIEDSSRLDTADEIILMNDPSAATLSHDIVFAFHLSYGHMTMFRYCFPDIIDIC